jgi:hypothetical protein
MAFALIDGIQNGTAGVFIPRWLVECIDNKISIVLDHKQSIWTTAIRRSGESRYTVLIVENKFPSGCISA